MIPQKNRLDIWIPEGDQADRLILQIQTGIEKSGGVFLGVCLTPIGWNLLGVAPTWFIDALGDCAGVLGIRVDRDGSVMRELEEAEGVGA